MRKLSKQEELAVIKKLLRSDKKNCGFIDMGSSRAVFDFGDYVVKIAADDGGRIQNKHEIMVYKECPDVCAELVAYGSTMIIMEKLDTDLDCYDIMDEYYYQVVYGEQTMEEFLENYEEVDPTIIEDLDDVLSIISEYLGDTSDNYQIGYSQKKNSYCLYDYGYDCYYNDNDEAPSQVGDIESIINNYCTADDFLQMIYNRIKKGKLRFNKAEQHLIGYF